LIIQQLTLFPHISSSPKVGGLAGVALGLLYFFQEKILYVPSIPGLPRDYPYYPDAFGLEYEDIWMTAPDNVKLNAWLMWPSHWKAEDRKRRPVLIFFQENAGNMAYRLPFLKSLIRVLDCSAFILSYRGYGRSEGSPTEMGLQMDADTAIAHVLQREDIDAKNIVLMGRSLGGAVAIYAGTRHKSKIRGIIIENTFTSIEETVPNMMGFLRPLIGPGKPCNWLVRNKWYSNKRIENLKDVPMLFLSSLADEMLHPGQMLTLYLSHAAPPWSFVPFEGARHMDCFETHAPLYWPAVQEFMGRLFPENSENPRGLS
jgi:abhydrolase domain-containing protein 13